MTYKNFIPEIWNKEIMRAMEKALVFAGLCNRNFEGSIKAEGDTVVFPSIGKSTAVAYTPTSGNITYNDIDNKSQKLIIDKAYLVAHGIEDIDKIQAINGLIQAASTEMGIALADVVDQSIAGLYADAGIFIDYSSSGVDSANIFNALTEARATMSEKSNIPKDMVIPLVVDPWTARAIANANVLIDTNNSNVITNGYIGKTAGFNIIESNNLNKTGSYTSGNLVVDCMAFTPQRSIGLAMQEEVGLEIIRSENRLKDLMRAWRLWGTKVLRANEVCRLKLKINKETTLS